MELMEDFVLMVVVKMFVAFVIPSALQVVLHSCRWVLKWNAPMYWYKDV